MGTVFESNAFPAAMHKTSQVCQLLVGGKLCNVGLDTSYACVNSELACCLIFACIVLYFIGAVHTGQLPSSF